MRFSVDMPVRRRMMVFFTELCSRDSDNPIQLSSERVYLSLFVLVDSWKQSLNEPTQLTTFSFKDDQTGYWWNKDISFILIYTLMCFCLSLIFPKQTKRFNVWFEESAAFKPNIAWFGPSQMKNSELPSGTKSSGAGHIIHFYIEQ